MSSWQTVVVLAVIVLGPAATLLGVAAVEFARNWRRRAPAPKAQQPARATPPTD